MSIPVVHCTEDTDARMHRNTLYNMWVLRLFPRRPMFLSMEVSAMAWYLLSPMCLCVKGLVIKGLHQGSLRTFGMWSQQGHLEGWGCLSYRDCKMLVFSLSLLSICYVHPRFDYYFPHVLPTTEQCPPHSQFTSIAPNTQSAQQYSSQQSAH